MSSTKSGETYKRKTQKEREALFLGLSRDIDHSVINLKAPRNKDDIKKIRKDSGLLGDDAAAICGVTRRTWTMWENYKNENVKDQTPESYPNDWQWGWFMLAINRHPKLRLIEKAKETDMK